MLVCVLCYWSNGSIRLPIHRHLNRNTVDKYSKQHKDTRIINKDFTLFSRDTSPIQLQWWPFLSVSYSREITMQGLNVSSPEADFAWQGGFWIPQATRSTQTLVLPTRSMTFGLQCKEPTVMLNPDRFLHGEAWIFNLSSARRCLWWAWPSVSSTWLYFSLCLVLLSGFTVHCLSSRFDSSQNPPTNLTVSVHGFNHSITMHVQFLSHLHRFTICNCAWSSLFGISMNA